MIVQDIQQIMEEWAPREIAWDRDNIGLQVGSKKLNVRGIFVCLDVTEQAIVEALRRRANLIISHHPLLFRALRSVDLDDTAGRCVEQLLRSKTTLYSAHTNLDFTRGGTSFALAEKLGLNNVDFLLKSYKLNKKIVTFVPPDHVDRVAEAMANAGAGKIGNYEVCSFRSAGTGTFKGNAASKPSVGQKNKLEHTQEVRLEMVADQTNLHHVLNALHNSHPYEEVAYDVYSLDNVTTDFGMGIIGELAEPIPVSEFVRHVKRSLGVEAVRHTRGANTRVQRVAACGGSGSDLTEEAIRHHADAFVTADVKYHGFHDASGRIVLVDAGHYETERPVVDSIVKRLNGEFKHRNISIPVYPARTSSNPIVYN